MKWTVWIPALLLGLVSGFMLGALRVVRVKPEFSFDGLATLGIGLLLFLGVQLVYTRISDDRRAERDLLISLAKDVVAAVDEVDGICEQLNPLEQFQDGHVATLNSALQKYSNSLRMLDAAVKGCKLEGPGDLLARCSEDRYRYKDFLTDSPYPNRFAAGSRRQQQALHSQLKENLTTLIFKINRI